VSDPRPAVAHLLRRTGFGPTAAEVDEAAARGYGQTVERLLDFSAADPADAAALPSFTEERPRQAAEQLVSWWLGRVAATAHPLREKVAWFWMGHFATSIEKVRRAEYMARQYQLFHDHGTGDFLALTQAVAKDPAMLLWLDAATNVAAHPNENFARELMELFTLGIGNYTEADVKEAARTFTGWRAAARTGEFTIARRQHDDGVKTLLGQTGPWGGEDAVRIIVGQPACAPFVVSRLWSHFAYPVTPADPVVAELAGPFAATHDIGTLVRAMLLHPRFTSDQARTGLVKQPVEWLVGLARALNLPAGDRRFATALTALGQVPFAPPSVGGWPQNDYWLSTASTLARLRVAVAAARAADLSAVASHKGDDRVEAAARLLSVEWSDVTRRALGQAADDVNGMVALALVSPEYTLA